MTKFLTTILITFLFSVKGYSDTLDFWHVKINDSIVLKLNTLSTSIEKTIKLNALQIKETDTLMIVYATDHANLTEENYFYFHDEMKRKCFVYRTQNKFITEFKVNLHDLYTKKNNKPKSSYFRAYISVLYSKNEEKECHSNLLNIKFE